MNALQNTTQSKKLNDFINSYQNKVITVPRGHNVGQTVIDHLEAIDLFDKIDIKTIYTVRDNVNKNKVVTLEYTFLQG